MKFRKKIQRGRVITKDWQIESIENKKHFSHCMRILSYFVDKDEVRQKDLIEEIFGEISDNKYKSFFQKFYITQALLRVRREFGIYIRGIPRKEHVYKLMNTTQEFENLRSRKMALRDDIDVQIGQIDKILTDINSYNVRTRTILDAIGRKLRG